MKMIALVSFAVVSLSAVTASQGHLAPAPPPFLNDDNCPVKATGPTATFDLEHDRDMGASLFCLLGITASQANRAISEFKEAVAAPDRFAVGTILKFPVEIVVPKMMPDGKRKQSTLTVHTRAEWADFVQQKLNDRQRTAIQAAKLSDMSIVHSLAAGPGFILGDGLVFFSTRNTRHITVWHLDIEVLEN